MHYLFQQQPQQKHKRSALLAYRKNYGPEQMKHSYEMWQQDGVSVHRAAQLCGVPVQTLRHRTLGYCDPHRNKSGRFPLMNSTEEAAFVTHLKQVAACGYGYTRHEIAAFAGETAFFLGMKDISCPVNDKWVGGLMNRWPDLKTTNPNHLSFMRARSATRETTHNYYKELSVILQRFELLHKPQCIFYVDEIGYPRKETKLTTPQDKERSFTVINCVSAIGQVVPSYLIYKGRTMSVDLLTGALPGTQGTASESGSANSNISQTYLSEHFLKHGPPHKGVPVLLLYDGHSSHIVAPLIEWAKEHNIIMFLLPAHTSKVLRPLDVCVFEPFKLAYHNQCQDILRKNLGRDVKHCDICHLVANAVSRTMTPGKIMVGFKLMGVFPFSDDVVTSEQEAPTTVLSPNIELSMDD